MENVIMDRSEKEEHKDSIVFSIVIPIYNVGDYLIACLDSVVSQTYNIIEIILVDDGSTDNSGNICLPNPLTNTCREI